MSFIIKSTNIGDGINSRRVLIEENKKLFLIKCTDENEILINSKYTPKLYSINERKYFDLNVEKHNYIYKYQYIAGSTLIDLKLTNRLFINVLKLYKTLFGRGCFIWDSPLNNIIVDKKESIFFVDLGGIDNHPCKIGLVFFKKQPLDTSDEELTERFIVFYLAHELLEMDYSTLSDKNKRVLSKMYEEDPKKRYKTYSEIFRDIIMIRGFVLNRVAINE